MENISEEEYEESCKYMRSEWEKRTGKDKDGLRRALYKTRRRRREWIIEKRPHSEDVYAKFPVLENTKLVCCSKLFNSSLTENNSTPYLQTYTKFL